MNTTTTAAKTAFKKPRAIWTYWREYLSISPFYLLFAAFGLFPLGYAIYLSTQQWDGLGESTFVGADQWAQLFTDGEFRTALLNTVAIFLFAQVPVVVGALLAAALLSNPRLRGKGFYQTLLFLPQVTSLVAVAVVFQSMFSVDYGIINRVLEAVGIGKLPWMTDFWLVKVVIAMTIFWRSLGYFMVVFLAGIAAIPSDVYDAARIDGAGSARIFRSITLPLLRPSIIFVSITGTISGFQIFTEPKVLFSGASGPNDSALTMMLMQVQYMGGSFGTRVPDLGYATVIGWAVFVILVILAVFNRRFLRFAEGDR